MVTAGGRPGSPVANAVLRGINRLRQPLALTGLIALCGASLNRVYHGHLLLALVAGAGLAAVSVSCLMRRAPAWSVAPTSVLALSAYAAAAVSISARAGQVDGGLLRLTVEAAGNALPRLLDALIPVEPQPDTVLAPVALAWLTGLAGVELAGRSRHPALGLLPPAVLYTATLVLIGPNAEPAWWYAVMFAVLAMIVLAVPASPAPGADATRLHSAASGAAGLAGMLVLVLIVVPVGAARVTVQPADLRRYVPPPSLDMLDENPLARISGWVANPDQHLLDVTVTTPGGSTGPGRASAPDPAGAVVYDTRLRLAVLTDWDGITWHTAARFRNAGRILPPAVGIAGAGRASRAGAGSRPPERLTTAQITIADLGGRLVPAVSAPRRIDGLRVAFDDVSGTLIRPSGLRSGQTYTVTSATPAVDPNVLPAAEVPAGPGAARYLAVGEVVPPDLSRLAEQIVAGEATPYLRALALESFLSEHYRYAATAPSGHAYPNLRFFLFGDPAAGGRRGTSEQFAAAFAALGRLLGLPTRIVVGFRAPATGGPVTGREGLAWPEVFFSGVGWVSFNPLPAATASPQPLDDEYLPKPAPATRAPQPVEPSLAPARTSPPAPAGMPAAGGDGTVRSAVVSTAAGLAAALCFLLVVSVVLRAALRRRRLNRGSPPQRVLRAWGAVHEALLLAGAPAPPYLTAGEVARHAGDVAAKAPGRHVAGRRPRPAAPDLADLAALVNAIAFAGPAGPSIADEPTAASAKATVTSYAAALRAGRGWWRRTWWLVDPRPLRRRD